MLGVGLVFKFGLMLDFFFPLLNLISHIHRSLLATELKLCIKKRHVSIQVLLLKTRGSDNNNVDFFSYLEIRDATQVLPSKIIKFDFLQDT